MPYTAGVAAPTAAPPAPPFSSQQPRRARFAAFAHSIRPVWSKPAAFRALRVTLVMPALFAFTSQVVGNQQMATFAAFGSFATLLFASFGGSRRDKLLAHTLLAVAGSVLISHRHRPLASTPRSRPWSRCPVAFCVLFSGIVGPNAASGAVAALVAYVLPATSRASFSVVPDRLAGWWLASVFGTLAVLLLSPRPARRPSAGRRRQVGHRPGRPAQQRAGAPVHWGRTVRRRWRPSAP